MRTKPLLLLLALAPLLSACPNELAAINNRLNISPVTITVQPKQAIIGDKVNVIVKATLAVGERSTFIEVPLSVGIGGCFSEGVDANGIVINETGFCSPASNSLSSKYRLLDGSTYFEEFGDVVLRRGEERTFEHSFSFTLDKADEVMLRPVVYFKSQEDLGPEGSGSSPVNVSFQQP